jgi:hypothetical protein
MLFFVLMLKALFSTASTRYGHRLHRLRFVRDFSFAFADADAPEYERGDCSSLNCCRSGKQIGRLGCPL